MEQRTEEMEIDLVELIMALLYRWWIIMLAGIATAAIAFSYAKFVVEPTFESTTSAYIISRQNENTITSSDISLGTQLMKDISAMVTSRTVMESVIAELNLDMTVKELDKLVAVSSASDTRFLYITVTHTEPETAQLIADTVRQVVAKRAVEIMNVEAVNVSDYANLPLEKAAPSVGKYTVLGGALGVFLAAGILVVLFLLDDTIKTPDDIEKYLGLSTLGSIPFDAENPEEKANGKKKPVKAKKETKKK